MTAACRPPVTAAKALSEARSGPENGGVLLGVLGPVVLHGSDGGPVRLGSARQRRLLAALVLHVGAPVGCDQLAELVWGEELPVDPDAALHTYVARLRRVLPAGLRIRTDARAYVLEADRGATDVDLFTRWIGQAPADLESLEAALRLWRGRP